jgi:hypothetical protein
MSSESIRNAITTGKAVCYQMHVQILQITTASLKIYLTNYDEQQYLIRIVQDYTGVLRYAHTTTPIIIQDSTTCTLH